MSVNTLGISKFLAHAFITTSETDISPLNIVKLLNDFEGIEHIMHQRKRSNSGLDANYLQPKA